MLIARTDWDVPKHRGITFFWFPMHQPGVEVRPMRQITDEAHFNEVFITDARVPADNLLGDLNDGWRVLQTALAYERSVMGDMARGPRPGGRPAAEMRRAGRGRRLGHRRRPRGAGPGARPQHRPGACARPSPSVYALRAVNALERQPGQGRAGAGHLVADHVARQAGHVAHPARGRGGRRRTILGAEAMLDGHDHPEATPPTSSP